MTNNKNSTAQSGFTERLRRNFQLSIIIFYCGAAAVAIGAFGVFRFLDGDLAMGIVDSLLVVVLSSIIAYSYQTDRTWGPGIVLVILNATGVIAVMYLAGLVGIFWAYVAAVATYFLSPAPVAGTLTLAMIASGALLSGPIGITPLEVISFCVTMLVLAVFAWIFSVRSALQHQQLEELATVDPLTGAWNRRVLENEMNIAIAEHQRNARPFGLLMLDLDYFKEINDTHGHAAGDEVLRQLVRLINEHTRRSDRLFRFGGEEFVLMMPDTRQSELERAARHVHQVIRDQLYGPGGYITCSVGGALLQPGDTWESWLQRADHALYEAKGTGRDTIIIQPASSGSAQNA